MKLNWRVNFKSRLDSNILIFYFVYIWISLAIIKEVDR